MGKEITKKTHRNNSVDIFRLICAILVIMIHTSPFYDINEDLGFFMHQILTRVAVPFFFSIAGFYYIGALVKGKKIFSNYTLKTLVTYIAWSVFYFLIDFIQLMISGEFAFLSFVKSCISKFFVYGSYYHFWFFPALIFAVITVTAFYKISTKYGVQILFFASLLLYSIGCMGCSYFEIAIKIPVISSLVTNGCFEVIRRVLLMGLPFFLLGGAINNINETMKKKKSYQWIFFVVSLLLFLVEIYVVVVTQIYSSIILTFMLYPLVASIVALLVSHPLEHADKIAEFSRTCANVTYYLHPAVILLITCLFTITSNTLLFIIVTVISVVSGWLYKKIRVKEKIFKVFNLGVKS